MSGTIELKVLLPTGILIHEDVRKIIAEAENGSFCLLPRHVDFVAALVPGLLFFVSTDGQEVFLAIDEGVLVKCGREVLVSTRNAVPGTDLAKLAEAVEQQFRHLDDREKAARSALARLESSVIRRFVDLGKGP
jgi:F-type H+-transporting ATPase subunit epsilon